MRKWGGVDEQYKELDFKLAVLTKQYNVSSPATHPWSVPPCDVFSCMRTNLTADC